MCDVVEPQRAAGRCAPLREAVAVVGVHAEPREGAGRRAERAGQAGEEEVLQH